MSVIKKTTLFILFFIFFSCVTPFIAGSIGLTFAEDVYYTVTFNPLNGKSAKEVFVKSGETVGSVPNPGQKSSDNPDVYFEYWADENGNKFNITDKIEKDTVLYARYSDGDTFLLSEYSYDYEEEATKLLYLNGRDNITTVNDPGAMEHLEIDSNGNSVYYVHSYGFVKYPSVRFKSGINVNDVENVIFRIYVHLSSPSMSGIDNSVGGFAFAGITATGIEDECVVIDSHVVQDKWIEFKFNRYQAATLADENGRINGFAVISNFKYNPEYPKQDGTGVYIGGLEYKEGGYVKIDYVGYTEREQNACLLTIYANEGEKPLFRTVTKGNAPEPFVPVKAGYEFSRWVDENGAEFDFSAPLYNDYTVYAEYVKSDSVVTVTFDDGMGHTTITELNKGGKAEQPADPVRAGHDFVCWVNSFGRRYDFGAAVNDDTVLYARYAKNSGKVLVDFNSDFILEDSKLLSLNGYTDKTMPLSDPYPNDNYSESDFFRLSEGENPYAIFTTQSWGFVKYPAIKFASVNVSDVKYIKIRVLVHVYSGKIDARYGGFAFSSVSSNGKAGTCYQIDANIVQDEWTDIIIPQADAALFADANGKISGISVVSNFKYSGEYNPTSDGSGAYDWGYVLIDSISYDERQENEAAVYFDQTNGNPRTAEFIEKGGKVAKPSDPVKTGYTFVDWVDENGNAFDFSKNVNQDAFIYARYKKAAGVGTVTVLSDFSYDYSIEDTSLKALNGNNNENTGNDPLDGPFAVYTDSDSGITYARYDISCWGFLKYPSVRFAGVHIDSVKYLKIRIYVHLNDGNIDNRYGGFALAGITAEGKAGECLTLPTDVIQDEWIDLVISPFDLGLFADSDGYINGIAVIANFKYGLDTETGKIINPTSDGSGVYTYGLEDERHGYVKIDYVAFETRSPDEVAVRLNRCNGSESEIFFKNKGDTFDEPTVPLKVGYIFNKWTDANGNEFDFNAPLTEDVELFATYKIDDGSGLNVLLDFNNDYIVGDYLLEYINGNSREEEYSRYKVVKVEKPLLSEKSGSVSYGVFSTLNYGSVIYPSVKFVSPVKLNDIDYLKIRLKVHLWNGNYDVSAGGFVICGYGSSGLEDECYMLAEGIKQDEWIEIILTRSQAALFADKEGRIVGISVGSMFRYDPKTNTTGKGVYVGEDGFGGYVYIDYIAYKENDSHNEVVKYDVTFNGYSEAYSVKVNVYDKVLAPAISPVKSGYKFAYWAYNGVKFDFNNAVVSDMVLEPVFEYDVRDSSDYVGAYTLNGKTVVLNSDGTLKIYVQNKLYAKEDCKVLSNGEIIINDSVFATYDAVKDSITIAGNEYSRSGGTVVYYNYGDGKGNVKTAIFGNIILSLTTPYKEGKIFVGWYKDSGYTEQIHCGDAISGDSIILYAKYTDNVVTITLNYTDYTGNNSLSVLVEYGKKLTVDFTPKKENSVFVGWYLKNGEKYDFDTVVNSSFTLYAKFEELLDYLTVADYDLDNNGTLEMFDGLRYKENSGLDKPNSVKIERVKADGTLNGYAYKTSFHTWAITITTNYIEFNNKIKVDDIDGLTLRMYAYLSPSSKYDTQSGGIKLYGYGYTGKTGEGLMLPESVKQNEWFDYVISKNDCYKLANAEGYIEGLQIGASLFVADMNLCYEGVGSMYILIDYVSVTEEFSVKYVVDGSIYEFTYRKGSTLEQNYIIPKKSGYMFNGWENAYGDSVSKDTVVTGDCVLYAKWIEKKSLSDYKGYYVNGQGNVIIIGDSISVKEFSVYEDVSLNNGKVYVLYNGTIHVFDLSEYHKAETVKVTYDYGFGKETREYPKNTFIRPLDISGLVSGFKGYVDGNGNGVDFAEGFNADVTVFAVIEETESSDFARYVGWYKLGGAIIKITANKKIDVGGTVTGYTVFDGILTFTLNGRKRYATINDNGIILDGETYLKLSDVITVSFGTGAVAKEPEKIEVYLSDGYVMQSEMQILSADGYNFLGWYDENGEKVENYSVFYESVRLYAKWEKKSSENPEEEDSSGCGSAIYGDFCVACCAMAAAGLVVLKRRRKV